MSKKGYKQTEEHKKKIRDANLGRKQIYKSKESRLKAIKNLQNNYWLGKKRNNPEYLEKIRIAHLGQVSCFKGKKRPEITGDKHPMWKGGLHSFIHKWVVKEKGKANNYICVMCKMKKAKHWSNIDHKYRRNLDEYRTLCVSCHFKYDYNFNNR